MFLRFRRRLRSSFTWFRCGVLLFFANTLFFFLTMFFGVFFAPATVVERSVALQPETITKTKVIEEENIIEVPSIMLPLSPEGPQAVVIDTTSTRMDSFMDQFYGENVHFFNSRQDATFLLNANGTENYSGLDISQIDYKDVNQKVTLSLDELDYETIWLFSDLSHIELMPTIRNVILYVPYQLTNEQIMELKSKGYITIITVELLS